MNVEELPAEAKSKLQSGVIVTDALQCVLELVHNSLDAKASGIVVRIDLKKYQIQVVDNGTGIHKNDLELVGERFMTSKYHAKDSNSYYGFKGQAISSLRDICKTLTIESKTDPDGISFVKVFLKNKALPITENESGLYGTGTIITLEDFMYSMPVRRQRINEVFDMEDIKTQLQYLAIIHYDVCFTLRNENKNLILLQTHKCSSILMSIGSIFGKTVIKSFKPINYNHSKYKVSGFLSMKKHEPSINLQLLFVNERIIVKSMIHKYVNGLMKRYLAKIDLSSDSSTKQGTCLGNFRSNSHNIFILIIKCSPSCYEIFSNMRSNTVEFFYLRDVLKCIRNGVRSVFQLNERSSDSSVNTKHHKRKRNKENNDHKSKFGISLLINAVRGAPAKRKLDLTDFINMNQKEKENDNYLDVVPNVIIEKANTKTCKTGNILSRKVASLNKTSDSLGDSLESPIPKKQFKPLYPQQSSMNNNVQKVSTKSSDQSFLEFYQWLKKKFESDFNAFRLYEDFLKVKSGNIRQNTYKRPRSPVLCRKFKENKFLNDYFIKEFQNNDVRVKSNVLNNISTSGYRVNYLKTKGEKLRVFSDSDSRMNHQALLRNMTENSFSADRNEKLNLINKKLEAINLMEKRMERATKQKMDQVQLNGNQNYTKVLSPRISEVSFMNFINFRNISESLKCPVSEENRFYSAVSNTWTSHHYEPVISHARTMKADRNHSENQNLRFEKYNDAVTLNYRASGFHNDEMNEFDFQRNLVHPLQLKDAEIQTSFTSLILSKPKADAMVQTKTFLNTSSVNTNMSNYDEHNIVPESLSYGFFSNRKSKHTEFYVDFTNHRDRDLLRIVQNQEKHTLNFWKMFGAETPKQKDNKIPFTEGEGEAVLENAKNGSDNHTSEIVFCGQKSNSNSRHQTGNSVSKETQTIAAMWSDCLREIGDLESHTNSTSLIRSSVCEKKTGSLELAKTKLIEGVRYTCSSPEPDSCGKKRRNYLVNTKDKCKSSGLIESDVSKISRPENTRKYTHITSESAFYVSPSHDFVPATTSPNLSTVKKKSISSSLILTKPSDSIIASLEETEKHNLDPPETVSLLIEKRNFTSGEFSIQFVNTEENPKENLVNSGKQKIFSTETSERNSVHPHDAVKVKGREPEEPLNTVDSHVLNKAHTQCKTPTTIGNTTSNPVLAGEKFFSVAERYDFIPKGLSPKFPNTKGPVLCTLNPHEKNKIKLTIDNSENKFLASVKWQDESTGSSTKPTIPDGILDEMRRNTEKNKIYYENEILSVSLSYSAIKVHNLLHSFVFTKDLLSTVEIIGQLDKKFIVTRMKVSSPKRMELISLFDQHAVDERIKLEKLTNDYISPEGIFFSSCLNSSINCEVDKSIVRIISHASEKLVNFGFHVTSVDEKTISVRAVPTFLLDKHEKDVKNKKSISLLNAIKVLITEIVQEMVETKGLVCKIPKTVHHNFCMEACHRAIKFNKALTEGQMTELINKLKNCRLPFQCAHGRPSVIPIVDLEDYRNYVIDDSPLNLQKLNKFCKGLDIQDDITDNS